MVDLAETLLTRAFGEPAGLLGRLGGRLMARGNAPTERHMIGVAELQPGQTVVLIGPGPGVGVAAAIDAGVTRVIAVDPSPLMLGACRRRAASIPHAGTDLDTVDGTAEHTGLDDAVADAVISVNNIFIWPDRAAGLAELLRILRPGAQLLISAHQKWLPEGPQALAKDVHTAGFINVETWTWTCTTHRYTPATQLRAARPA